MKNFIILILTALIFTNCEKNDDTPKITTIEYVGFESGFTIELAPNETIKQEVKVATSTKSTSNRAFFMEVIKTPTTTNSDAYSIPESVTVLANKNVGTFNIDLIGPNIKPFTLNTLAINFIPSQENVYYSEPVFFNIKHSCSQKSELYINLTFNDSPEEVYWKILNENNEKIYESVSKTADAPWGAYAEIPDGSTINLSGCLDSGTYTFVIEDQVKNGGGPFNLTLDGKEIFKSDGNYKRSTSTTFIVP